MAIEVVEARTHNLRGIDCRIPHKKVTVVTGLSGAGKSSLVFDTIYAEAQRRFVESMSTYARQFLDQMERPPIEAMHNILPAVALVARNSVKNARSTVGTITEVHDVLRLLYTHLGEIHCPNGHGKVRAWTPEEVAAEAHAAEDACVVLAPIPRPSKKGADASGQLRELIRQGFYRLWENGEVVRLGPKQRWLKKWDPLPLVLGRFKAGSATPRLVSAIEDAYKLTGGQSFSGGTCVLEIAGQRSHYGRRLTCSECGVSVSRPVPALFSFNSPLGACTGCQGFGRVIGVDPGRVVPDVRKTLRDQPIAPWNSPKYEELYDDLYDACRRRDVSLDTPWEELDDETRDWIWNGDGGRSTHTTIEGFFRYLERKIYKMHIRVLLSRYRAYNPCPDCGGLRLKNEALGVRLKGLTLPELSALSIEDARAWLAGQTFSRREKAASGHLLEQLGERLETLHRVGLDYLTLDRQARTLSGGEAQRIQLAAALGSGLTSTLYVLDEPTIGLHPRDSERLLGLLHDIAGRGNTVLVVEHDRTIIEGADHVIDLGPRAGEHGGEIMAEGTFDEVMEHPTSLTAEFMRQRPRRQRSKGEKGSKDGHKQRVVVHGASANNLVDVDVEIPLGCLVAVTGVSGSGKSTLVKNVIHGTFQRSRGVVDVEPGECESLEGVEDLADIVLVDQRPLGRSTRSNPVTYTKAYDEIRKLFAATPDAKRRRIEAGHFSFNLDRGRCPECQGTGVQEVDMQFMASVTVTCDECQGRRFRGEILAVTYQGRNIHETLELTVQEALEFFADVPRLGKKLQPLVDVGLGYLRLGQSTSTLSGGEAQRLKLASFLDSSRKGSANQQRLFLFDEPTTGLHLADIDLLVGTLRRLVNKGHGVVVVEHSLDLVAQADWIVDLGPGGGHEGGRLMFSGPVDDFLDTVESPTARELRRHLHWRRRRV